VRENRTHGSEGGAAEAVPTPIGCDAMLARMRLRGAGVRGFIGKRSPGFLPLLLGMLLKSRSDNANLSFRFCQFVQLAGIAAAAVA
jgi:hypothetical protein